MSGGWIQASVSMPYTARSQSRWRTGVRRRAEPATRRRGRPPRGRRSRGGAPLAAPHPRDRPARSARPMRTGRSPARRSETATTPQFLRGSTRALGRSRQECRAARRPARDRGGSRRQPHRSRPGRQAVRRAAPPRPWRECGPTRACRDIATRPGTVRAPAVRRRARPPLRTAGARTRAACCGG